MKEVPNLKSLMKPTIEVLDQLGGSGSPQEVHDGIVKQLEIPDEVVNIKHSPGRSNLTRLRYRLGWVLTYLKRYSILENPKRGVWTIVPGKQNEKIDSDAVMKHSRGKYNHPRKTSDRVSSSNEDGDENELKEELWRVKLFTVLTEVMSPDAFERLAKRLLRECNFTDVQVTGKAGDGGIDGTAIAMINDLLSFPVIFQCKRYTGTPVSARHIRDFRGAMTGRADRGLFITTATFTRDARKEATRDGAPPIDLIDGEKLMDKLKELRMGISTETVEEVTVNEDWYGNI